MKPSILVTGAAGFIGSNFVEIALAKGYRVIGYDALTYAGHLENLEEFKTHSNYKFVQGRIQDQALVSKILKDEQIGWLVNFAAESHVDKSITGPADFMDTNIQGVFALLNTAKNYFETLSGNTKDSFRFLQISTDEVYGTLGPTGKFSETTAYQPNSPYSSSKAAADLLVRAWFHTYSLPTITTNCSNNYGPKQFPEKLIPHMVFKALSGAKLPVYGRGENIRDWIHVKDHASGVLLALEKGRPGETYCLGGNSERTNLNVVKTICSVLDRLKPIQGGASYSTLIDFVTDRPGHDMRYAIDDRKAEVELGFVRKYSSFETGLEETVIWYLEHLTWSKAVMSKPGTKVTYDWSSIQK